MKKHRLYEALPYASFLARVANSAACIHNLPVSAPIRITVGGNAG